MSQIPVVEHHRAGPTPAQVAKAERLARKLEVEQPALEVPERFRALVPTSLEDAPTLHLDDLSAIPLLDRNYDISFVEDRARLRAGDGDFVASCAEPVAEFEPYCREHLGLGSVTWLRPRARGRKLRVADACWSDSEVRRRLLKAIRSDRLLYVHPHIGSFLVWAVALLFAEASGGPLKVIAPPPGVTGAANHKLWFADVVRRLFGRSAIPRTERASDFATLAVAAQRLAEDSERIVVKIPDSAGGAGNKVVRASKLRGLELGQVRRRLKRMMEELGWWKGEPILVSAWESYVLSSPSAQLWIPPVNDGEPVVEGLYEQLLEGPQGQFVGSRPAHLPPPLAQEITDQSWLLGRLFQLLGYVGRCSFDLLLIGRSMDSCRIAFVECNGRWGGTSGPMTLMNRLFSRWSARPYVSKACFVPGVTRFAYADVLEHFSDELFDARTDEGRFIFFNPGGFKTPHGVDLIALGEDWSHASEVVEREFMVRLQGMVGASGEARATLSPDRARPSRTAAVSEP
jgi:hypothetical protein